MSKTITGTWVYASASPVANGLLTLTLSQDAVVSGTNQVAPRAPIVFTLNASGQIPSATTILANDELTPSGTVYTLSVAAPGGGIVYGPETFSIAGASPINLNNSTPTSVNVVLPSPVLLNPSGSQTISGQDLLLSGGNFVEDSAKVIKFGSSGVSSPDTGISRDAAGVIDIGNGTQGDKSGSVNATNETLTGVLTIAGGSAAATTVRKSGSAANNGMWMPANGWFAFSNAGTTTCAIGQQNVVGSTSIFGFSNGDAWTGSFDGGFSRLGAARVALGNGTAGDFSGTLVCTAIQGPGFQEQKFTGNGTFTIPSGITQVKVTIVGGGGGGAGSAGGNAGSGGGGGGTAIVWLTGLTPGNTITVTVGGGGGGGAGGGANNGNPGNASSISSGSQTITTVTGGAGGAGTAGAGNNGGAGGSTTNATIGISGQAGTLSLGTINIAGSGGDSLLGLGAAASNGGGSAGTGFGSGGAGATGNASGGNGAGGIVIFEWVS